jgi:hypothetical protein
MKVFRWFLYSAAAVLLLTAAAKLISSFGHGTILQTRDPLTGFQFQDLFRIVGGTEVAVALVCIFSKRTWLPAGLVAWLSTSFLAYRIGLVAVGYHRPCSCMGNLTDALHIPPQTADTVMKIILAYLLIGSYATLFWLWRQRKKAVSSAVGAASFVLCFLLTPFNSKGEEPVGYEVEGNVVFSGKPLKESESGTFIMRVEGCNWNIRLKRPSDPDYTEVGYDGTNLVTLFSYEHFSVGKKAANVATVHINKNEIPRNEFSPQFAMIWLTYGSKCYFDKKNQGDLLEPVNTWDSSGAIDDLEEIPLYHSTWKRQNQFPSLPIEVIYLEAMPKSFFKIQNSNYTNSVFRVSSFTTNEGFEYPKTAMFETYQFLQQSNSTTDDLQLFSKYELELTAVHNITASQFTPRPQLPGTTLFVDDRISQVGQITYLSSNWMTESQLVNNKGFKSLITKKNGDNFSIPGNQPPWKKRLVLIVLATISLLPLLIIIVKLTNKNKK